MFESVLCVIIGYIVFSCTSAPHTGGPNKFDLFISNCLNYNIDTSLRYIIHNDVINNKNTILHIHHWIIGFILFLLLYIIGYTKLSMIAFGVCIHGVVNYNDWYHIIYRELKIK